MTMPPASLLVRAPFGRMLPLCLLVALLCCTPPLLAQQPNTIILPTLERDSPQEYLDFLRAMASPNEVALAAIKAHPEFVNGRRLASFETPIFHCINNGRRDNLQALLNAGADINLTNSRNVSPLHHAIMNAKLSVVPFLLENGAKVNAITQDGNTPLHLAVNIRERPTGAEYVLTVLLERGANPNLRNDLGYTPLHTVLAEGRTPEAMLLAIPLLLKAGAEINALTDLNNTPLLIALLKPCREDVVFQLLDAPGVQVNCRNNDGATPLVAAVVQAHSLKVVQALFEKGADMTMATEEGILPLHYAAWTTPDVWELLLKHGADIHAQTRTWETPLFFAAKKNNLAFATWLLDKGAKVDVVSSTGETVLFDAARYAGAPVLTLLLDKGAALDVQASNGRTPLHQAVTSENREAVQLFLARKANPNIRCDLFGETPLHLAAANGDLATTKLLLAHGADVTIKDQRGKTPLMRAKEKNRTAILNALTEAGAKE